MLTTLPRKTAVAAAALGLALTAAPMASAAGKAAAPAPITVNLTVKGSNGVVFSGDIKTTGHNVTTASGGTHKCDSTNNKANPTPGATPTAALDDAAKVKGFTWDATWYAQYDDFFVNRIAKDTGNDSYYWNIAVNGKSTEVGGCQYQLKAGDKVAFTWTAL
ncbi:DUF4430 domain-containing protein [Streptomyces caatingaensis]|uniref:Transcobalamin-like C-terminal domain-containing protein n=1 Tax=Streptomyces caatingaensis TaxID=1678637 RepID=A0A0K9XM43_9ACTN|nr:DUF4430 domain-containing protein [Streptomyces caatingaensis]KNB53767.1 hypothetical protein AC230_03980 [Streptomyces caatingaensis]